MSDVVIATHTMLAEMKITDDASYRDWYARWLAKNPHLRAQPQDGPLHASIESAVWLGRCECQGGAGGVGVSPAIPTFAACGACGRSWEAVVFPDAAFLEAIDRVLILRPGAPKFRPLRWYSWDAGQTVKDLRRENARQGWPRPEEA